jgi:hypothetical protein
VYASVLDNRTQDPIFIPGSAVPGPSVIVPVVARTPGLGGTVWRSDVSIHNPTNATMILELRLLGTTRSVTLFPGHTTTIEDVMTFMGAGNGTGALEIVKPAGGAGPIVSSRTYTPRAGSTGTFGQFVPARDTTAFTADAVITGLRSDAAFRTNVGFVSSSSAPISITVTLIDGGGVERGRTTVTVGPKGQVQMPLSALFTVSVSGRFSLRAHTDAGPVMLMYGSVIDNSSGDPIFSEGR